jgi:hypothetical protein
MTQQFIRTLQQLRHEILVLPFRERIANYINVLTAPTNLGKTFSIFNIQIKEAVDNGITHIIITAPDTMIHRQSMEAYEEMVWKATGLALYTKDSFRDFLKRNYPSVILLSNTKMCHAKNDIIQLKEKIGPEKFMVLADEMHYGGTTHRDYVRPNTGYKPATNSKSGYVFANLLKNLSKDCKNIVSYTATPLYEMKELGNDLYGLPMSAYNILNEEHQWPVKEEFNLFNSRLGGYLLVDTWMQYDKSIIKPKEVQLINKLFNDKKIGLVEHSNKIDFYSNNLKNIISGTIFEDDIGNMIDDKTVTHFVVGAEYESPSENSASIDETLKHLKNVLRKFPEKYKGKYPIMTVTGKECRVWGVNDGDSYSIQKDEINDILADDQVQFLISVEMLKMGFNCPRITHMVQIRKRKQDTVVVNGVIQALSRGNRLFFGLKGIDSLDKLIELCLKLPNNIKYAVLEYAKYFNQHFAILPKENIYEQGIVEDANRFVSDEQFNWGTCKMKDHVCDDPFCTIK